MKMVRTAIRIRMKTVYYTLRDDIFEEGIYLSKYDNHGKDLLECGWIFPVKTNYTLKMGSLVECIVEKATGKVCVVAPVGIINDFGEAEGSEAGRGGAGSEYSCEVMMVASHAIWKIQPHYRD